MALCSLPGTAACETASSLMQHWVLHCMVMVVARHMSSRKQCQTCGVKLQSCFLNRYVIAGWTGAISIGRQELSTEQLVQCFADNIGRPVSVDVRRGPKQSLSLKVIPQRAC